MKRFWRVASCTVILAFHSVTSDAIIMRHDIPEKVFMDLARNYPATVTVRRADGRGLGDEGTLIDACWVLTAAHVAAHLGPGDIAQVAGADYRIDRVVRHPDWKTNADLKVDIALIRLSERVSSVKPVALYRRSDEQDAIVTFVGRGGYGTGLTGPVAEDRRLRAATNSVLRVQESLLVFRFDPPDDADATKLEGISGPGDSGGPAYLERDGKLYVIGVSSGQDSRPADRKEGHYKVLEYYPRVSHFAEWILRIIREDALGNESQ